MVTSGATDRLWADLGELQAAHRDARDLDEFARYRGRPVDFFRDELNAEPWQRQIDILEATERHPLVVVRSCNGAGKDWTAARWALYGAICHGALVIVSGPTLRQVREIVGGEIARAFHRAGGRLPGELFATAFRVPGHPHAGILQVTSTEASRLTGLHAPKIWVDLTEAQGVEPPTWEGLLACAVGPDDRLLVLGNPLTPSGRFYDVSRSDHWFDIQISAEEHPNVIQDRLVIPGGVTRAFIQRIADEYGAGSNTYRSRVLGEFPDAGEESLYRRSWLDASNARWAIAAPAGDEPVTISVDPAEYGPDLTAVCVRRGRRVEELVTWGESDLMETVERVRRIGHRYGCFPKYQFKADPRLFVRGATGRLVVDTIGVGLGVYARLRELGYNVQRFNAGSGASQSRFLNARAEGFWKLREMLEADEIDLPPDSKLIDELLAISWAPTTAGKIQIVGKSELRSMLGRSIDRADALMMALPRPSGIRMSRTLELI